MKNLSNKKHDVSINGYDFNLAAVKLGAPQGSILDPFLFLIYINDFNQPIKFSKFHHFANDTTVLHFNKTVNKLNKYFYLDLKTPAYWLNATKISVNVKKLR